MIEKNGDIFTTDAKYIAHGVNTKGLMGAGIALERISDERIQVELSKMFRFNTPRSLATLMAFPMLTDSMFSGSVSLDATMKQRGRG